MKKYRLYNGNERAEIWAEKEPKEIISENTNFLCFNEKEWTKLEKKLKINFEKIEKQEISYFKTKDEILYEKIMERIKEIDEKEIKATIYTLTDFDKIQKWLGFGKWINVEMSDKEPTFTDEIKEYEYLIEQCGDRYGYAGENLITGYYYAVKDKNGNWHYCEEYEEI